MRRPLPRPASIVIAAAALACCIATSARAGDKPSAPPPPAPATADPAHEAAARMQKFYESTRDLHARFEQEQVSVVAGTKKASGEVWLKKPGRMRWEYDKPEKKLMVADGKTLWVYEPEDEQAFKHDLKSSSLPSSVTFLFGEGRLESEFDISMGEPDAAHPLAAGDVLLKLVPRKPTAQYHHLDFVVDGKTHMVKETVVHDQQGGQSRMRFLDVKTNQGAADAKFTFSPPPGTRILKP
jgi:outer membrane lipoprotein carrier protein